MCKYSPEDLKRAIARLAKSNPGDAATLQRYLKDFKTASRDKVRTAKITRLCRGVMDTKPAHA